MRRRGTNSAGFTLVEMLAVVLIIAIVVTLVVSGGGHITRQAKVKQTQLNLKIILRAVNAFRDDTGDYPVITGNPADPAYPSTSSKALFSKLQANGKSLAVLGALAGGCIRNAGFMDGFDNYIRYLPDKGAGGGPLLESAGPDLNFTNAVDNIRSDD